ncbi:tetratricopeptide repeat protein [Spirosoma sordidisoli]|uniref:Tetratricopeptide repeat protein n=1 Tax=Spirosoma sordidisoli TaxID=2502893 RepID=A0A4Q2ULE8_9BACT|nr:tetratricopeptide repeat protein [Spirosoma sordidisoli]RYC70046.1 tetratricopeptide repeat protein [Spirosoma sordidisoli]
MKKPTGQLDEWDWIERYWSGQLTPTEKTLFEQLIRDDKRVAQEAEDLRFGVQLVDEVRIQTHARQTLYRIRQRRRQRWQRLSRTVIGAGCLAAACLAFILYLSYAPIVLSGQENDPGVLREWRGRYRMDTADQLSIRQQQAIDRFYEGQAYLVQGQAQLAAQRFEEVLSFQEIRPYFREVAQWHLIVCYLRTKELPKAEALYKQLDPHGEYEVGQLEQWKIWWHLQRLRLFG